MLGSSKERRFIWLTLLFMTFAFLLSACLPPGLSPSRGELADERSIPSERSEEKSATAETGGEELWQVEKGEAYLRAEEVAAYLRLYRELPPNFISKEAAREQGWNQERGNLWDILPGTAIGGDRFGNREGKLPTAKGRRYYECDVNYEGGYRGGERLVYSTDGLIFYSGDHYRSFLDVSQTFPQNTKGGRR